MPVSPFASTFPHLCQSRLVVFSIFFASILFSIATSSALTSNQSYALGTVSRTWPNSTLIASQTLSKGSVIVISIATFLFLLVICFLLYCCVISPYCSHTRRQRMLQSRATSASHCTTPTGGLLLTKSQKLLLISVFCVVGAQVIAFDPLCANPSEFPHLMHTIGSIDGALWAVNDDVNTEAVQATTRVLQQFGPQLRAFTFRGIDPFGMICQVEMMSRLRMLSIQTSALIKPLVEQIIPWAQLHSFTFMCPPNRRLYQFGPMFELFGHMTQLRKLSFTVAYREKSTYRKYYTKDKHAQDKDQRLKMFLSEQIGKIPPFSMLEVFCLKFDSKKKHKFQTLVNYRLFLDLFAPKLGMKMKKLIIRVPRLLHSTNNCISLDLVNGFPQLESLVFDYADNCRPKKTSKLICNLDRDDEHNQSQSIRRLTIKDIVHDCLLAIKQIPVIFPNLVELNIGGRQLNYKQVYKEVYRNVTDHDFVEMIKRLPHLRALRFIDDHCKFLYVLNSIELMCKRATELKPKVPMEFRVPLDQESKFMLWQTRRMSAYYCFEMAAQWIRIY